MIHTLIAQKLIHCNALVMLYFWIIFPIVNWMISLVFIERPDHLWWEMYFSSSLMKWSSGPRLMKWSRSWNCFYWNSRPLVVRNIFDEVVKKPKWPLDVVLANWASTPALRYQSWEKRTSSEEAGNRKNLKIIKKKNHNCEVSPPTVHAIRHRSLRKGCWA